MTRTATTVRRGAMCLGAAALLTALDVGVGASSASAADSLQVTPGGATLLNMAPGEIRTMTTDIYNPTARDAQVSTVASTDGEIGPAAGHILLTVDSCSVPWTDVTPAGAPDTEGDRTNALVLACADGEEQLLSDWAVMGTTYADSTFRVDSGTTTYLRTQVRLGDDAPQAMQGVHGSLSYSFASVEAPPRVPDDPTPGASAGPVPDPVVGTEPVAPPTSAMDPSPEPGPASSLVAAPRGAVTGEVVEPGRPTDLLLIGALGLIGVAGLLAGLARKRRPSVHHRGASSEKLRHRLRLGRTS